MMRKLELFVLRIIWICWPFFCPNNPRKSWAEVVSGSQPHTHKFTIPIGHGLYQCEHNGCTLCDDLTDITSKHIHSFDEFVMMTGNDNSLSEANGVKYLGPSCVKRCNCGQWGVLHRGAKDFVLINTKTPVNG